MTPGPSRRRNAVGPPWGRNRLALLAVPLALAGVTLVNGCRAEDAGDGSQAVPEEGAAEDPTTPAAEATSLERAEALYRSGDFPAAVEVFSAAADSLGAAGDSTGLAVAWTWLGLAHWQLGTYPDARRYGE